MNRREFTKSLAALFAVPAIPLAAPMAVSAAPVAAISVPSQARFWAIYMTGLHGKCSPKALQTMLNIPAGEAQGYLNQLVSDGVIKPNNLLDGLQQEVRTRKVVERKKPELKPETPDVPPQLRNLRAPIDCHCLHA